MGGYSRRSFTPVPVSCSKRKGLKDGAQRGFSTSVDHCRPARPMMCRYVARVPHEVGHDVENAGSQSAAGKTGKYHPWWSDQLPPRFY